MYQPSEIVIHLHITLTPIFTVIIYTIVTTKNCLALAIALTVAIFLFLNLSLGGGAYYYNRLTNEFDQVILDRRNLCTALLVGMFVHMQLIIHPLTARSCAYPKWLSSDSGRKLSHNKSFPNGDFSSVSGIVGADTADSQTPLTPYTIEDLLDVSSIL